MTKKIISFLLCLGLLMGVTAAADEPGVWGSWRKTLAKGKIVSIHLSIHADKPANPNDPASYSQPGDVLWERDFFAASITETLYRTLTYYEWWEDPYTGVINAAGDNQIWQYDIAIKPDQTFRQTGTPNKPVIYWLAVYVKTDSGLFGWKTSSKHWSDNAIYRETKGVCQELIYPEQHPKKGQAIDLSFEISMPGLPHIALDTLDQWRDSLLRGSIVPFELSEWNLYMAHWSATLYPGSPA